jgi:hypothetical protein
MPSSAEGEICVSGHNPHTVLSSSNDSQSKQPLVLRKVVDFGHHIIRSLITPRIILEYQKYRQFLNLAF